MAETLEKLAEIGKTPLGENPPDPRKVHNESPEFDVLEQEIAKLSSLKKDTVIKWREVISASSLIIREKSKDLEAATYLCRGLWERERYAGLRVGFTILRDIIQTHWDIAYPPKKKPKMRAAKIEWLVDRVGKILAREDDNRVKINAPKPEEKEAAIACAVLIKEIESLLYEKLDDNAPILREVRAPLHEYQQNFELEEQNKQVPEPDGGEGPKPPDVVAPPPPPPPPPPTPTPPHTPPPTQDPLDTPQPPEILDSAKDIKKAFAICHSTFYKIAAIKRGEKLSNPIPYRLLRFSAWMSIETKPAIDEKKGNTYFPPPSKNKNEYYTQLLEKGQYADLIEEMENIFARPNGQPMNAYWLDAHRFTAMALEGLGPQYSKAKQAVMDELAAFLRRFPDTPDLTFNDGKTAFADAQTKLWISEQVLAAPGGENAGESGEAQAWIKTAKEAKQLALASKDQFAEGLSLLQEGGKSTASQREQFFWLLEQARFCYDTDHVDLAVPLLEFLEKQVARFALEEWEPRLSVDAARLLLMCHNKLSKDKKTPKDDKMSELNKRLYARLCRLDVSSALALSKQYNP
ncbi:hypothetical protein PN36_01700 [Candidatus Thiomargarita nelsonii]|uniref:ImpA N-terminal domain-containing protein n=1 Tax=Candidatus Thiomargarita nelsonii TaxID=1003181 RepID=A0A0A6PAK3_9GAMM|nr:hypothetical protein PN36_01700 [Candidatus Thiomargarita nelsonii]